MELSGHETREVEGGELSVESGFKWANTGFSPNGTEEQGAYEESGSEAGAWSRLPDNEVECGAVAPRQRDAFDALVDPETQHRTDWR